MNFKNSKSNISLKNYNTFGIDVKAEEFIAVKDIKDLIALFNSGVFQRQHLILGGGSNMLLTQNFKGTVIKMEILGISIISEDDNSVYLEVGAGENWHQLVLYTIDQGWGGIENLSLIPGTVGAAPMQNIGAYGVEIKNVFASLFAFDKKSGEVVKFEKDECQFDYRSSVFKTSYKGRYVICKVILKLSKKPQLNLSYGAISETLKSMGIENPGVKDLSNAVINIRSSKLPDPAKIGNAGSFFKNPVISIQKFQQLKENYPNIPSYPVDNKSVKVPAGWLIEMAGWKGKKYKNTGVHEKQALVLINRNNANGSEVYELAQLIIKDIKKIFDIQLESEVNII